MVSNVMHALPPGRGPGRPRPTPHQFEPQPISARRPESVLPAAVQSTYEDARELIQQPVLRRCRREEKEGG